MTSLELYLGLKREERDMFNVCLYKDIESKTSILRI